MRGTAQISGAFGCASGELTELSLGGAFVEGIPPFPLDSRVRMHILLPRDRHMIVTRSRVLYIREKQEHDRLRPGVGFAFEDISDVDSRRIASAVERSDLLHMRLLFSLQMNDASRDQLDEACLDAGIPPGLPAEELTTRVAIALRRYRGEI